ncbi:MAG: hypothetical protein QGG71_18160 [Pirellulaceae bacterium]|nr:hypothetical protein [Pirellulaceae bacterium]
MHFHRTQSWPDQLQPPGLATKGMTETWERYYDHYLDGKLIPRPTASSRSRPDRASVRGWLTRNGRATLEDNCLRVRPDGKRNRQPFIVTSGFSLPPKLRATVRLRTEQNGFAGFAWREAGQKEFPADQVVRFDCRKSPNLQQYEADLNGDGKIIHIRLLLPDKGADLESITLHDDRGQVLREWRFNK